MHLLSGHRFEIGGDYSPTIEDVAVGLSRIPRWAGATLVPWSVLQHSLIVFECSRDFGAVVRLYSLWHDCEEIATGDIPKPFKTREQSALQQKLFEQIWSGALKLQPPCPEAKRIVKLLDHQAKVAEVHCLVHPRVRAEYFDNVRMPWEMIDALWNLYDVPVGEAIDRFVGGTKYLLEGTC